MKHFARLVLRLATVGIPVFIAACYGMPARFNRQGKVIDRDTHEPISGIKLSCVLASGEAYENAYSGTDGTFVLYSDSDCVSINAEDVDGALNGSYQTASVAVDSQATGEITVQMTKAQ